MRKDKTIPDSKLCKKCQEIKPSSEFYCNWKAPDCLHSICKLCAREYAKTRRDEMRLARTQR
jgi:hypothetical protein